MVSLRKYKCKIKLRKEYKGQILKEGLKLLEGKEIVLEALWLMDTEDPYPGEWAMGPVSIEDKKLMFANCNISWIASGDIQIINVVA